jgi:hypothetical protein
VNRPPPGHELTLLKKASALLLGLSNPPALRAVPFSKGGVFDPFLKTEDWGEFINRVIDRRAEERKQVVT